MIKSVYIMVMDGVGVGEAPDAEKFGDKGSNTFLHTVQNEDLTKIQTLLNLGMIKFSGLTSVRKYCSACGKMREKSAGKDTSTGHWEIAGLLTNYKQPTYPNGFPPYIIDELKIRTGRNVIGNIAASGTEIIKILGEQHMKTGDLIVYTSADSVMQIAAHEDVIPVEELYRICLIARNIMSGKDSCGRIIARPFTGNAPNFIRTAARRDFSVDPHGKTMLDVLSENGIRTTAVGKITDIFNARGITDQILSHGNKDCLAETTKLLREGREGLVFVNLVDFDMEYGHRNNKQGFFDCLVHFNEWLENNLHYFDEKTLLLITADHGCDPTDESTDHTREFVPIIAYKNDIRKKSLGTRKSFADISATVLDVFGIKEKLAGESFADKIIQ